MSDSPSPSDDIKLAVKLLKAKKQDELKVLKIKLETGDHDVTQVIEDPEQYMNNQDEDGDLANIVIFLYNAGIDNIESFLITQINQLVKPTKKAISSKKVGGAIKRRTYKKNKNKHKGKKKPKSKRHEKSRKSRKGRKGRK
jgi:hypothetical protein